MRGLRRIGIVAAGLLVFLLGVALVLPPLWDWNRQRDTMEAFAAAALGRAVRIEGAISLTLLPEPMLSAGRVRVLGGADEGELRIRSLRLGVALWPLLRGRVVARELVLRGPELRLPWPPTSPLLTLPAWYAGFAGRVEDGQMHIGAISVRDIQANLVSTDDGALTVSGRAPMGGHLWQLSARIGQPGRDGAASTDITVTGRDRAAGHGLAFTGSLGGVSGLRGRLSVHGQDLSLWLPAPAMAFRAEGALRQAADGWAWGDIGLDIGGVPARASLGMTLLPTPGWHANVAAARADLDAWGPAVSALRNLGIPASLDIAIDAATHAGSTLRQLRGRIAVAEGMARLTEGQAVLPGDAQVRLAGQLRWENNAPVAEGQASLRATDPRTGLRWLAGIWGKTPPELPADMLRSLSLTADIALNAGRVSLSNLKGQIDKTRLSGQMTIQPGPKPTFQIALNGDQLAIDPIVARGVPSLADILDGMAGASVDLRLQMDAVTLTGRNIQNALLDVLVDPERVLLRRLGGTVEGAQFSGSGLFGASGNLADGKLEISADNAGTLTKLLPPAWQGQPDLWDGRLLLRLDAAGTMPALSVQLGLELGDARLEAQPILDLVNRRAAGRISLRHPNAVRLLAGLGPAAIGVAGLDWLGEGSLALQTPFNLRDEQISLDSFDLTAGSLRANGRIGLSWQGGARQFGGRIVADALPLPWHPAEEALPGQWLRGWAGTLHIQAGQALLGDAPVLENLACVLTQDVGTTRLSDCTARVGGGEARIDASLDHAAAPPVLRTEIAIKDARLTDASQGGGDDVAFGMQARRADAQFSLQARGHSIAALRTSLTGPIRLSATDGAWRGFDLAAARTSLLAGGERGAAVTATALRAALSGGETEFQELTLDGDLKEGMLILRAARSSGMAGTVAMTGQIGVFGQGLDLRTVLQPAGAGAALPALTLPILALPTLALRLNGPRQAPGRVIDIADALRWLSAPPP